MEINKKVKLDKHEIISATIDMAKKYNIDLSEIIVIMSAALVLQDIKEFANDIDLSCDSNVIEILLNYGLELSETNSGLRKIAIDNISLYENWSVSETVSVCGVKVASIDDIVNDKRRLCRKKDLEDLLAISNKLQQKNDITSYILHSYPNILRGSLHKGNNEIVIIVTGYFSANRIGYNSLFFQMADAINAVGYSVLRIDLSAMGESDGNFSKLVFNQHIADLFCVISDLKSRGYDKIHLVGHCEGCFEAIKVLDFFDCIKSVVLIAPTILDSEVLTRIIGENGLLDLRQKGHVFRKGLECDQSFFNIDMLELGNICLRNNDHMHIACIMAENDELADNLLVSNWANTYRIHLDVVDNSYHNFTDCDSQKCLFDQVIKHLNAGKGNYGN